jgi:hypothetical protein
VGILSAFRPWQKSTTARLPLSRKCEQSLLRDWNPAVFCTRGKPAAQPGAGEGLRSVWFV